MLREQDYVFRRANQAADAVLAVSALLAAHYVGQAILRPWFFPRLVQPSAPFTHAWAYGVFPAALLFFQAVNSANKSLEFHREGAAHARNALSALEATALTALLGYGFFERAAGVSRVLVAGGGFFLALLLVAKVWATRRLLLAMRNRTGGRRRILVVGSGKSLRRFIRQVRAHPIWGFEFAAVISDCESLAPGDDVLGARVAGRLGELSAWLDANPVDEVVFVPARAPLAKLRAHLEDCELRGLRARLAFNFHKPALRLSRAETDLFEGTPLVTLSPSREVTNWKLLLKYSVDRIAALAALILLSPIYGAIALAIKLTSPKGSPIFYAQTRCGLNGKLFSCYKFRSMHVDADKRLAALQAANEMSGPVFKMKDDPRITDVGKFLRRWSLDELPQLWNIARGDMSLVGPRPPIPSEVLRYDRWQRRRLSMKPGLTCLWQVSGRNLVDFDTWMKLDLEYIDNWSLWLDFKILCRTALVVVTGYGAM
jgi:exopolysaccharide biosynthesis polyprenyl glycosylphosphotransferase